MKLAVFVCLLMLIPPAYPQMAGRRVPPGIANESKHPPQIEPPTQPRSQRPDPLKLQQDARDLADLAASVPTDIDQVNQGVLPKELLDKLKRIEKLSKHLRGQLGQ